MKTANRLAALIFTSAILATATASALAMPAMPIPEKVSSHGYTQTDLVPTAQYWLHLRMRT